MWLSLLISTEAFQCACYGFVNRPSHIYTFLKKRKFPGMHVCKQLGVKILNQIPHEEGIFSKPVWTREMITLKVN